MRKAIGRCLDDACITTVSLDGRFALAYEAALLYAKMAIACAGWRVRGEGAHERTFFVLKLAIGPTASPYVRYYQASRRLRNELTYERAGVVDAGQVRTILERTRRLGEIIEAWIANHHPDLA